MENLNQSYWHELREKYPAAMKHFGEWLLVYMDEIKWDGWFGTGRGIGFMDIPLDMQIGIFDRYNKELRYTNNGTPTSRIDSDTLLYSQLSIAKFFELAEEKQKRQSH